MTKVILNQPATVSFAVQIEPTGMPEFVRVDVRELGGVRSVRDDYPDTPVAEWAHALGDEEPG